MRGLRVVLARVSGRRHRRRAAQNAHNRRRRLRGLRTVPAALSGRLHRNAPARISTDRRRAASAAPAYDACIKCGFCVPVCPVEIDAADLLAKLIDDDWEAAAARNLSACIECRRCDAVCPSEIPLASILGAGKKSLLAREAQTAAAKIARQRGDERARRLESLEATAPPRVSAAAKKAAIERARAGVADKPR